VDDRVVFTAIVFVLTTGCAWRHPVRGRFRHLDTQQHRFVEWTRAGLWRHLHRAVLDWLGATGEVTSFSATPIVRRH
jgi:transposase